MFPRGVKARHLKIQILEWNDTAPCLQMHLQACRLTGICCVFIVPCTCTLSTNKHIYMYIPCESPN